VKLWNYQRGEMLDNVDCSAFIESDSSASTAAVNCNTSAGQEFRHQSNDVRCIVCNRRLVAISFNE